MSSATFLLVCSLCQLAGSFIDYLNQEMLLINSSSADKNTSSKANSPELKALRQFSMYFLKIVPSWVEFWLVERNPLCGTGRVGMLEVQPQSQGRFGSCWGVAMLRSCTLQLLHSSPRNIIRKSPWLPVPCCGLPKLWKEKYASLSGQKPEYFHMLVLKGYLEAGLFFQWLFHGSVGVFQLYLCQLCRRVWYPGLLLP